MEKLRLPTDEEIGKAFDQGQEAVIGLFHNTFEQLIVHVRALEDRVAKNSSNSRKAARCGSHTTVKLRWILCTMNDLIALCWTRNCPNRIQP